ncbi:hypothetical protein B0H14DRAFT_3526497 [Mycena olivaceomarginata]|nr:hypothetical protein B0H14DRAFT_3526497 [Mycena olivaceomarginata]
MDAAPAPPRLIRHPFQLLHALALRTTDPTQHHGCRYPPWTRCPTRTPAPSTLMSALESALNSTSHQCPTAIDACPDSTPHPRPSTVDALPRLARPDSTPVASMSALDLTSRPPQRPAPRLERRGRMHEAACASTPAPRTTPAPPLDVRTTPVRPTPVRCPPTRTLGRWLLMRHPPSSTPCPLNCHACSTPTPAQCPRPLNAHARSMPTPAQCPRPLNALVPARAPLDVCRSRTTAARPLATRVARVNVRVGKTHLAPLNALVPTCAPLDVCGPPPAACHPRARVNVRVGKTHLCSPTSPMSTPACSTLTPAVPTTPAGGFHEQYYWVSLTTPVRPSARFPSAHSTHAPGDAGEMGTGRRSFAVRPDLMPCVQLDPACLQPPACPGPDVNHPSRPRLMPRVPQRQLNVPLAHLCPAHSLCR